MVSPVATERMIPMPFRQHFAMLQLQDQCPQQFHLLAATLRQLCISFELRCDDNFKHSQMPSSSNIASTLW